MTTREQALNWWNNLCSLRKTQLCDTNTEIVGSVRRWESLSGSEIKNIWRKEGNENIYLKRLKEAYKLKKEWEEDKQGSRITSNSYNAIRSFCLDCSLLSFAEIEQMEFEINNKEL